MRGVALLKEEHVAELLHWTTLDCIDVPNKVAGERIFDMFLYLSTLMKSYFIIQFHNN